MDWKSRFTLGLNAAKGMDSIEKCFHPSCAELNFLKKTQWSHISISPESSVARCGEFTPNWQFETWIGGLKNAIGGLLPLGGLHKIGLSGFGEFFRK